MARILVIDDEKNIRKMVKLTLERDGHEIEVAPDGARGLELFGDGTDWDLVLTDQRMPGLQGLEVTRAVRRRSPSARIVMMTAFATLELASDVLLVGATDFLRKPFSTQTLRGAVSVALSRAQETISHENLEDKKAVLGVVLGSLPSRSHSTPPITFYWNGFRFWPTAASQRERQTLPQLSFCQVFQIRGPNHETSRCLVVITPHVESLIQEELTRAAAKPDDIDLTRELVCQQSLAGYLWQKAEMPPELLPVYELTSQRVDEIRRLLQADDDD